MWILQGEWLDGVSTQRRELTLQVGSDGRISSVDGTVTACHFAELQVSDRLGDTPCFLQFPDGARLVCHDQDTVDALCQRFTRCRPGLAHHLEKRLSIALLALAVVVGVSVAAVRYGVPVLAKTAAFWLPPETSVQLGEGALATLDAITFSPSQLPTARQQELRKLLEEKHRCRPSSAPIRSPPNAFSVFAAI